MIVTCPQCTKRFLVEDKLIPETGRQVRCTVCSHMWRQLPDTPPLVKAPPFLNFSPAQEFVEARPTSKKRSKWKGFLIFLGLVVGIGALTVVGYNHIFRLWPRVERLYRLVGLPVETEGFGLTLSRITPIPQIQEGAEMVVITGEVKNTSGKTRHLSPLKMKIVKGARQEEQVVDEWEHTVPISVLLPGESIHFETDPRPRVEGGERVIVGF